MHGGERFGTSCLNTTGINQINISDVDVPERPCKVVSVTELATHCKWTLRAASGAPAAADPGKAHPTELPELRPVIALRGTRGARNDEASAADGRQGAFRARFSETMNERADG
jgi:hypothetical protein